MRSGPSCTSAGGSGSASAIDGTRARSLVAIRRVDAGSGGRSLAPDSRARRLRQPQQLPVQAAEAGLQRLRHFGLGTFPLRQRCGEGFAPGGGERDHPLAPVGPDVDGDQLAPLQHREVAQQRGLVHRDAPGDRLDR
jgi:hypothetical protein